MVTKKRASARKSTTTRKAATTRKASPSTSVATRRARTRRRRTTSTYPRRRRPGLPTTLGAALGTLLVATLLEASWPVRLGLVATVVVVGLAYVVWRNRSELATVGAAGELAPQPGHPVNATDTTASQGDSTHE